MFITRSIQLVLLGGSAVSASLPVLATEALPAVNVNADFYATPALELGDSVSVFDEVRIQERGAEHLEQLFNLAPNVNFAAGASRGRYIQIRGIGERSQFVDPVNPSVGVLVDGIDFTGISTAASLLDVRQVEILRGPQGTLYGANALAGLVSVMSHEPGSETSGNLGLTLADYNSRVLKGAVGGPLGDKLGYRLALQSNVSDGYMENAFLRRDDTNNIDETTLRGKLRWQARDDLELDFTALMADVDNGYDAFSLNNSRKTLSDQPGRDTQETLAAAIKARWQIRDERKLELSLSHADSQLEYGYDEDWAYSTLCSDFDCAFGADSGYSSYDNYLRDNRNTLVDARLVEGDKDSAVSWVAGFYMRDQSVDLRRVYTYLDADFSSQYDTRNAAVYGQFEQLLGTRLRAVAGLRYEQYDADYADAAGFAATPSENLLGGKLGLEYRLQPQRMAYALVSRGYKPGGFNASEEVPEVRREFKSESMWNYEIGIKGDLLEQRASGSLALFYQDRRDIQAKQYFAIAGGAENPATRFVDFIDNAATGSNYGIEAQVDWSASDRLSLTAALGLLHTEFDDFSYFDADGAETIKDGRDQAHAPRYQYSVGINYLLTPKWLLHAELEGKDGFYFSDSHDQKSAAYDLVNLRLSYLQQQWELALWGRNLTDETYSVRGFEFGNDPRDGYATQTYTQAGAPRLIGVSASYSF